MRLLLTCLAVLLTVPLATAATPDPLSYIPKEATLVLKVEKPRSLAEAVSKLDAYREYEALPAVKAALDSATAKQFFRILKAAEDKLGQKWPDLLDSLAGGGVAVGTVTKGDNSPFVLALQGTDEAKAKAAFTLVVELITAELARQSPADAPYKPDVGVVMGADALKLGNDFFLFRYKATLVLSNTEEAAKRALALATGEKGAESVLTNPRVTTARKQLGGTPLAWFWFDLKKAKDDDQGLRDFLETARTQAFVLFVLGSTTDALRRADDLTGGLFQTDAGFKLSVQLPARRADLPPVMALHAPLTNEAPGSLPFLEPPGVLASHSMYLDVASFWKQRKTALGEEELKDLEKTVKDISAFLPGTTLAELIEASGTHHRVVLVERGENQYKTIPDFPLPEMALVSSMRDAKFGKNMLTTLRAAALFIGLQVGGLTMKEEKHDGVDILTYRFNEAKPLEADPTNIRFNFVPSFAVIGDSFVVASSPKLLKDLIPEVRKPIDPKACSAAVWRAKGYGTGAAQALKARPEATITDTVLNQGVGLDEAKKQLEQTAAWLAKLGTLGVSIDHGETAFKFELNWQLKK
ncbi:MAG: hypothetical protein MUF18_02740 [Fimbriiglobus sp.]|jgi:hypothetical protein|nr:hypothetical protein [Fimbriiglobus sp.]